MVGIFDTSDNFALGMAANELDRAGIPYDIVAIPALSLNRGPAEPKWWVPPQRILVAKEDEDEATALIEPLKYPVDGSDPSETRI